MRQLTRDEVIDELEQDWIDGLLNSWDLSDIVRDGMKGLTAYTNDELVSAFKDAFDKDIRII